MTTKKCQDEDFKMSQMAVDAEEDGYGENDDDNNGYNDKVKESYLS